MLKEPVVTDGLLRWRNPCVTVANKAIMVLTRIRFLIMPLLSAWLWEIKTWFVSVGGGGGGD